MRTGRATRQGGPAVATRRMIRLGCQHGLTCLKEGGEDAADYQYQAGQEIYPSFIQANVRDTCPEGREVLGRAKDPTPETVGNSRSRGVHVVVRVNRVHVVCCASTVCCCRLLTFRDHRFTNLAKQSTLPRACNPKEQISIRVGVHAFGSGRRLAMRLHARMRDA